MRYERLETFDRALESLPPERQLRVLRALERLRAAFASSQVPHGLGLKPLQQGFWEVRAGLRDRLIFRWSGDAVALSFVGTHDEITRFLRHR